MYYIGGQKMKKIWIGTLLVSILIISTIAPIALSADPDTEAAVNNVEPCIYKKWEEPDEDEGTEGVQIYPNTVPDGSKTVFIYACVCDPNGNDDIETVLATVTDPSGVIIESAINLVYDESVYCDDELCCYSHAIPLIGYSGSFEMDPCYEPGTYKVTLRVTDAEGLYAEEINYFEYYSLHGLLLDFTKISWSGVPGDTNLLGTYIPVGALGEIRNIGNTPIDVKVEASNLTGVTTTGTIPVVPNMEVNVDLIGWAGIPNTFDTNLDCDNTVLIEYRLDIPAGTPADTYQGTTTITAIV
jgi:hypothetical protein